MLHVKVQKKTKKTKTMTVGRTRDDITIKLENEELKQVDEFVYTVLSVTLSHRRQKKSGSTPKIMDVMHQKRCCRTR